MTNPTPDPAPQDAGRRAEPPEFAIKAAIEASKHSPCQSKRGVAVFTADFLSSRAWNWKPVNQCDGSATCKATCRVEAIHAEQSALVGYRIPFGAELLHVKTVDGELVASGPPSCADCSKLIISAQIAGVWLFHADGWTRYEPDVFHRLSLSHDSRLAERDALLAQVRTLTEERDFQRARGDKWVAVVERRDAELATLTAQQQAQREALETLISEWRRDAQELREATSGAWIEPGVREACADELASLLVASSEPEL